MDAAHQSLLRLYDEPLPVGLPPQAPDEAELLALLDAKAWMDARPRRAATPDAAVLDAIFRAAAHGSPDGDAAPGVRHDRAPLARPNRFSRAFALVASTGALAALATVALIVPLRPAASTGPAVAVTAPASPRAAATASAPVVEGSTVHALAPQALAPQTSAPATVATAVSPAPRPDPVAKATAPRASALTVREVAPAPAAPSSAAPALRPDADEALAVAQRRAALLRARLDSAAWDAPVVGPSGATPRAARMAGFSQASHQ